MKFSLLSWNVENFDGNVVQLSEVTKHIKDQNPDVFGLFEVENIDILDLMRNHLDQYDYSLTDGPENKEILIGVHRNTFEQVTFTQKREFKLYNPYLRPGALITLEISGELYNILFLHTDSGTEARDFGNRYEMFEKIWSLKSAIDKIAKAQSKDANFIVLGDLNTMGLLFPTRRKSDNRVSQDDEIKALKDFSQRRNMVLLPKEFNTTFSNGKIESNLDHILASNNIKFDSLGQHNGEPFFVRIRGWHQLQGQDRLNFINNISDHCSLYCQIQ